VKPYKTPEKLMVSIVQAKVDDVCRVSYDLNQNTNAFINECVGSVIKMMEEETPTLPPIVTQYKALKAANALKSQLEAKTVAVSSVKATAFPNARKRG
jgi:hypothetical protein